MYMNEDVKNGGSMHDFNHFGFSGTRIWREAIALEF